MPTTIFVQPEPYKYDSFKAKDKRPNTNHTILKYAIQQFGSLASVTQGSRSSDEPERLSGQDMVALGTVLAFNLIMHNGWVQHCMLVYVGTSYALSRTMWSGAITPILSGNGIFTHIARERYAWANKHIMTSRSGTISTSNQGKMR